MSDDGYSLTPDQIRRSHEDSKPASIYVHSFCIALATMAVVLRFFARRMTRAPILIDDYSMVATLMVFYVLCASSLYELNYGAGLHAWAIDYTKISSLLKASFAHEIIYNIATAIVKVSILLLYLRIFIMPKFKVAAYIVGAIVAAKGLAFALAIVFQCTPISDAFSPANERRCINYNVSLTMSAVLNVVLDVVVLLMPAAVIRHLHITTRQKIIASGVFMLGLVACILCAIRLKLTLHLVRYSDDFTWDTVHMTMFAATEVALGIICSCLTVMGPLLRRGFSQVRTALTTTRKRGVSTGGHVSNVGSGRRGGTKLSDKDDTIPITHTAVDLATFSGKLSNNNMSGDDSTSGHTGPEQHHHHRDHHRNHHHDDSGDRTPADLKGPGGAAAGAGAGTEFLPVPGAEKSQGPQQQQHSSQVTVAPNGERTDRATKPEEWPMNSIRVRSDIEWSSVG